MTRIRSQLRTDLLTKLRESGTNSFSETQQNKFLNYGKRRVNEIAHLPMNRRQIIKTVFWSECSDAGTSTGTTLYLDSVAGLTAGMDLWVNDGTNYEMVTVSSISGSTVTLVSPGLQNEYSDGDDVAGASLYLPIDCQAIEIVKVMDLSDQEAGILAEDTERNFEIVVPYIKETGQTTHYYKGPADTTTEGKTANFTAIGGTTATSVVASTSLTSGHETDYYKDWLLINTNTTHKGVARVSGYTLASKTFALVAPGISGTASGDTFFVAKELQRIYLYPIPDKAYRFYFTYFRDSEDMNNDYDYCSFGEYQSKFEDALLEIATAEALRSDSRYQEAADHEQHGFRLIDEAKNAGKPGKLLSFQPAKRSLAGLTFYNRRGR